MQIYLVLLVWVSRYLSPKYLPESLCNRGEDIGEYDVKTIDIGPVSSVKNRFTEVFEDVAVVFASL